MVSFEVSHEDGEHITRIVGRAVGIAKSAGRRIDPLSTRMDIMACHANGTPLRLADLANADDFNIAHDVFGIGRHIDRSTGRLTDHFRPRFARAEG